MTGHNKNNDGKVLKKTKARHNNVEPLRTPSLTSIKDPAEFRTLSSEDIMNVAAMQINLFSSMFRFYGIQGKMPRNF